MRGCRLEFGRRAPKGDHFDRADVRFVRPNIQIYDAHVVDLYQWVCARYLVGVKAAKTKANRSYAQLLTEFQNGSRWLSQALSHPEAIRGPTIGKR